MKVKVRKLGTVLKHSLNPLAKDFFWAYHPIVIEKNGEYFMFYTGKSFKKGIAHHLLLAKSKDLLHWDKVSEEVLGMGKKEKWDSDFLAHNFVFEDEGKYYMLYDGSRINDWLEEIGLAESKDLLNWKKFAKNPVFKVGKNWWEKRHVSRASIFKEKDTYYMYYAGHDGQRERVGLVKGKSLPSLKRFLKDPVLDVGGKGEWDESSISDPRVFKYKGKYVMSYSGIDGKQKERMGLAISSDLVKWKKYEKNPILDISKNGSDTISASRAHIVKKGKDFYIFYSSRSNKYIYNINLAKLEIE